MSQELSRLNERNSLLEAERDKIQEQANQIERVRSTIMRFWLFESVKLDSGSFRIFS